MRLSQPPLHQRTDRAEIHLAGVARFQRRHHLAHVADAGRPGFSHSRVDRRRTLSFSFNGRAYQGLEGDTLASVLLANGVSMVARSWK